MHVLRQFFSSSDEPGSLGAQFRRKRLAVFESLFFQNFDPTKPIKILDVGGTAYFWKESSLLSLKGVEILLLNLHEESSQHPQITGQIGNATSMPEFETDSFDLIFSNSVIEHLYTWENQQKMADEIQRVGKKYFVQTPNKYFPIEAHYALPFAQFWPKSLLRNILIHTPLSRFQKWSPEDAQQYLDEIRLLDEREMKTLFPKGSVLNEKVLGMTKSITLHNL